MRSLFVVVTSCVVFAAAPRAQLIKNINVVPQAGPGSPVDSNPAGFVAIGNRVYFAATSIANGREYFYVDSSGAPAQLLSDVEPGAVGSDPADLVQLANGLLLFTATTTAAGREVWVSNGTAMGTNMLLDISGPGEYTLPSYLVAHQGFGYFLARPSGSFSMALWRTDGTTAGTVQIDDLGLTGGYTGSAQMLVSAGSQLFYTSSQSIFGGAPANVWSLYTSDGTVGGSQLVLQQAESTYYGPRDLTAVGTRVIWSAQGIGTGLEPWVSDGTQAGTSIVDVIAGNDASSPSEFTVIGNHVYFAANAANFSGEVFVSDGTVAGTIQVTTASAQFRRPISLHAAGNLLAYAADDGVHGYELWTTGPTPGTETLVVDLVPGIVGADPLEMIGLGNGILFRANTSATGYELFFSDGTPGGTYLVADIAPGPGPSHAAGFTALGNQVIFAANSPLFGNEVWVTDGTPAGTQLRSDIAAPSNDQSSFANGFVVVGDRAVFKAHDGLTGNELWSTDGTAGGTQRLTDFLGTMGSVPTGLSRMQEINGRVFLMLDDGVHGAEPWVSDGTVAGTHLLADLAFANAGSYPRALVVWHGELYFSAGSLSDSFLYATDGTTSGTRLVSNAVRVIGEKVLVDHSDRLYFAGNTAAHGTELWSTDGTTAGTTMVVDLNPGTVSSMYDLEAASFAGHLYFAATDASWDRELWRTDGTASGTTLFANISATQSSWPHDFHEQGGYLVFAAYEGTNYQYFSTDSATVQQLSFAPLFVNTNWRLASNGQKQIAMMRGANYSFELWGTDGTVAGSGVIKQIHPDGNQFVNMRSWRVSSGNKLLFAAADAAVGSEIFITDGTAAGTGFLADLRPGPDGSSPEDVVRLGDKLLFGAYDPLYGFELYGLPFALVDDWVAQPFGIGCAGASGVPPRIGTSGSATLGATLTIELSDAVASSPVFYFQSPDYALFDLGPCAIHLHAPLLTATGVTNSGGATSLPVAVPNVPGLLGVGLWVQAMVLDSGGALLGVASVSPALELRIGN